MRQANNNSSLYKKALINLSENSRMISLTFYLWESWRERSCYKKPHIYKISYGLGPASLIPVCDDFQRWPLLNHTSHHSCIMWSLVLGARRSRGLLVTIHDTSFLSRTLSLWNELPVVKSPNHPVRTHTVTPVGSWRQCSSLGFQLSWVSGDFNCNYHLTTVGGYGLSEHKSTDHRTVGHIDKWSKALQLWGDWGHSHG